MNFVNKPLINLKKICFYKMWLVQFPIDMDCHFIIKQLTKKLYMRRQFIPPLHEDINNHFFHYNRELNYINEQGVVFILKFYNIENCIEFTNFKMIELFPNSTDDQNNMFSYFNYGGNNFIIDFKLSEINTIIFEDLLTYSNVFNKYRYIIKNPNTIITVQ